MRKSSAWPYLLPLPVALMISFVIWELRYAFSAGHDVIGMAWPTIAIGLPFFPVGLAAPFVSKGYVLQPYCGYIVIIGYALYFALSVVAKARRSRELLTILLALLVLNMLGCQLNSAFDIIPIHE